MNRRSKSWLAPFFLVTLGSVLQNTGVLMVRGVKPNLPLVLLVALAFFTSELGHFVLAILLTLLPLELLLDPATIIIAVIIIALGAFLIHNRLPGKPLVNLVLMIGIGTFLFYLIVDPAFLGSDLKTVLVETVYNALGGLLAFALWARFLNHEKASRSAF